MHKCRVRVSKYLQIDILIKYGEYLDVGSDRANMRGNKDVASN